MLGFGDQGDITRVEQFPGPVASVLHEHVLRLCLLCFSERIPRTHIVKHTVATTRNPKRRRAMSSSTSPAVRPRESKAKATGFEGSGTMQMVRVTCPRGVPVQV